MRRVPTVETLKEINTVTETISVRVWPTRWHVRSVLFLLLVILSVIVLIKVGYWQFGANPVTRMPDLRVGEKYYEFPLTAVADGDDDNVYVATTKSIETFNPRSYVWHRYDGKNAPGFPFGASDLAYSDDKTLFMLSGYRTIWTCPVDGYFLKTKELKEYFNIGSPWEGFHMGPDTHIKRAIFENGQVYVVVPENGLGIYDPVAHGWTSFPLPEEHKDSHDMQFYNEQVWLGTQNGVYVANRATKKPLGDQYQLKAEGVDRIQVDGDNRALAFLKAPGFFAFDGTWKGPFLGGSSFEGATDDNVQVFLPLDGSILAAAKGCGIGKYDTKSRRWIWSIAINNIPLEADADFRELRKAGQNVLGRTSRGLVLLAKSGDGIWPARKIGTDAIADVDMDGEEKTLFYSTDSGALYKFGIEKDKEPELLIGNESAILTVQDENTVPHIGDVLGEESFIWIGLQEGGILRYDYLGHRLAQASGNSSQTPPVESMGPVDHFISNGKRLFVLAGNAVYEYNPATRLWERRTAQDLNVRAATARNNYIFALDDSGIIHVLTLEGNKVRTFFTGSFSKPGINEYTGEVKPYGENLAHITLLGENNMATGYDAATRSWTEVQPLPPDKTVVGLSTTWMSNTKAGKSGPEETTQQLSPALPTTPLHVYYRDEDEGVGYDAARHLGEGAIQGNPENLMRVVQGGEGEVTLLAESGLYHYIYSSASYRTLPLPSQFTGSIRSLTPWGSRMLLASQAGGMWLGTPGGTEWTDVVGNTSHLKIGKQIALWDEDNGQYSFFSQDAERPSTLHFFDGAGIYATDAKWVVKGQDSKQVCFISDMGLSLYDFSTHNWINQALSRGRINQVKVSGARVLIACETGLFSVSTLGMADVTTHISNGNVYWIGSGSRARILVKQADTTKVFHHNPKGQIAEGRTFGPYQRFSGDINDVCLGRVSQDNVVLMDRKGHAALYNVLTGNWEPCDLDNAGTLTVLGVVQATDGVVALQNEGGAITLYLPSLTRPGWTRMYPDLPAVSRRVLVSKDNIWVMTENGTLMEYRLTQNSQNGVDWSGCINASTKSTVPLENRIEGLKQKEIEARQQARNALSEAELSERHVQEYQSRMSENVRRAIAGKSDLVKAATEKRGELWSYIKELDGKIDKNQKALQKLTEDKTLATTELAKAKDNLNVKTKDRKRVLQEIESLEEAQKAVQSHVSFGGTVSSIEEIHRKMPSQVKSDEKVNNAIAQLLKVKEERQLLLSPVSLEKSASKRALDLTFDEIEVHIKECRDELSKKEELLTQQEANATQSLAVTLLDNVKQLVAIANAGRDHIDQELAPVKAAHGAIQAKVQKLEEQITAITAELQQQDGNRSTLAYDEGLLEQVVDESGKALSRRADSIASTDEADRLLALLKCFEWQTEWREATCWDFAVREDKDFRSLAILTDRGCFVFDLPELLTQTSVSPSALCVGRLPLPTREVEEIGWANDSLLLGENGHVQWKANLDRTASKAPSSEDWMPGQGVILPSRVNKLSLAFDSKPVESPTFRYEPGEKVCTYSMKFGSSWEPLSVLDNGFLLDRIVGIVLGSENELLVFTEAGIGVRDGSTDSSSRYDRLLPKNAWPGNYSDIAQAKERLHCIALPDEKCYTYRDGSFSPASPDPEMAVTDQMSKATILQGLDGVIIEPPLTLVTSMPGEFQFDQVTEYAVVGKNAAFMTPLGVWLVDLQKQTFISFEQIAEGRLQQLDGEDAYWERGGKFYQPSGTKDSSWQQFDHKEPDYQQVAKTGPWIWEAKPPLNGVRIVLDPNVAAGRIARTMTNGRFDDDRCLSVAAMGQDALLGTRNGLWKWSQAGVREYVGHAGSVVSNVLVEDDNVVAEVDGIPRSASLTEIHTASAWQEHEGPMPYRQYQIAGVTFIDANGQLTISSADPAIAVWDGSRFYFDQIVDVEDGAGGLWTATAHGGILRYSISGDLCLENSFTVVNAGLAANETEKFAWNDGALYVRCRGNLVQKWSDNIWVNASQETNNIRRAEGMGLVWERPNLFDAETHLKVGDNVLGEWYREGKLAFDTVKGISAAAAAPGRVLWATGAGIAEGNIITPDWSPEGKSLLVLSAYREVPDVEPVDVLEIPEGRYIRSSDRRTLLTNASGCVPHPSNLFTKMIPHLGPAENGEWIWGTANVDQDQPQQVSLESPMATNPLFTGGRFSFDCALGCAFQQSASSQVSPGALKVFIQGTVQVIINEYAKAEDGTDILKIIRPLPVISSDAESQASASLPNTTEPSSGNLVTTCDVRVSPAGQVLAIQYEKPENCTVWCFTGNAWARQDEGIDLFKRRVAAVTPDPYTWSELNVLDPRREMAEPQIRERPDYTWLASVPDGACFAFDALNRMAVDGKELLLGTQGGVVRYAMEGNDLPQMTSLVLPASGDCSVSQIACEDDVVIAGLSSGIYTVEGAVLKPYGEDRNPFFAGTNYKINDQGALTIKDRSVWATGVMIASSKEEVKPVIDFEPARRRNAAWVLTPKSLYFIDGY